VFLIFRETTVLCLGAATAAAAAAISRLLGNRLELLPGIVVPIAFCLGRLCFARQCSEATTAIRRAICQLLLAFALIALFVFEMGVGLFIDANDIPIGAWAIVGCFGAAYVVCVLVAESVRASKATKCAIEQDTRF
jgi:hypothetical protein